MIFQNRIIMKKTIILIRYVGILILLSFTIQLFSQVPQKINYQSVAQDSEGNVIGETPLTVKLSILAESELVWQETHSVQTNKSGLFSLLIGSESAVRTGGSATLFSDIAWNEGNYQLGVAIDKGEGEIELGSAPIVSVPYALYAENAPDRQELSLSGTLLTIEGGNDVDLSVLQGGWELDGDTISTARPVALVTSDPQVENPLFEVRNDDGNPVFAVYNDGVMVYVDENKKGIKGGFAVGGYSSSSKGVSQEYLRITPDSVRIYVPDDASTKGIKGGFAVGGYNPSSKAMTNSYLEVTRSNTNVYFDTTTLSKGVKGGFAVGGYSTGRKGETDQLMSITPENYLIGQDAGAALTTGVYNSFMGYQAGLSNTTGSENIFLGYQTGYNNLSGGYNTFIGHKAGYSTSSASGSNNVFVGESAGLNNLSGDKNIFIGNSAGRDNTAGGYNVIIGTSAGQLNNGHYNVFIGYESGMNNISGGDPRYSKWNTFMGYRSGRGNTTGWNNLAIGYLAGLTNQTATNQFFIGNQSGQSLTEGFNNTFVGHLTGANCNNVNENTFIGYQAGFNNYSGSGNTFIGNAAGLDAEGSNNVFIGNRVGWHEGGSGKLHIDNSDTPTPLIYGDFVSDYVIIHDKLGVGVEPTESSFAIADVTGTASGFLS